MSYNVVLILKYFIEMQMWVVAENASDNQTVFNYDN